jgi:uncharacterized membrane protein YecN with MAPEG domain
MPITALYAGLLVPLFVLLSVRVIGLRRDARVSMGDGGDAALLKRMRVHANFAEYVPLALLLMLLAESLKTNPVLLHGLGIALLGGRLAHAGGMSPAKQIMPLRVAGVALTFTVLGVAALVCLAGSIRLGAGL